MVSLISRLSAVSAGCYRTVAENLFDFSFQLSLLEGLALDLVVTLRIHQIFRPENHGELAHIHFRDQHFVIALHYLPQITRERIQIAQVNVPNAMSRVTLRLQGGGDRAVS